MFATSGLAITLFLGGWSAPFSFLTFIPTYIWFFAKLVALIFGFIWIRGTLPRLRMDQLMNLAWEFILPMALLNMLVAGVWHFMPGGLLRWLVCIAMIAIPCMFLARGLKKKKKFEIRTYSFAE
jgi:NADH-quinone oxidoreductase subunit H